MTDQELDAVLTATRTIPPENRAAFLEALGHRLQNSGDGGQGIVDRAITETKRNLFGPTFRYSVVLR